MHAVLVLEHLLFRIFRLFRRLRLNIFGFGASTRIFADYFKNFHKTAAVRGIFGEDTEKILHSLKVELSWFGGYMFVNDSNGHLVINRSYLYNGDKIDIYLDLIHELYHIKQHMDGRELFDPKYDYVERPTEVEAYRYTVQEAKRMGLSDERICQYLQTEWMTHDDLKRLARAVNVSCS